MLLGFAIWKMGLVSKKGAVILNFEKMLKG
jgi:hypothetical protein